MATLSYSDIIEPDSSLDRLIKGLRTVIELQKQAAREKASEIKSVDVNDSEQVQKYAREVEELHKSNKEALKTQKALAAQKKKNAELADKELAQMAKEREEMRRRKQEAKLVAQVNASIEGSVERLKAELALLTLQFNKLTKAELKNGEAAKKLIKDKERIKKELKEIAKIGEQDGSQSTGRPSPQPQAPNTKNLVEVEKNKIALQEARQEAKAVAIIQNSAAGSVQKLRAELTLVTLQWKKLSQNERENTEEGRKIVASKKRITDELKKLEKETSDNRREVGNYTESIVAAVRQLRSQREQTLGVISQLKKEQSQVKKNSAEWKAYAKAIDKAEKELDQIKDDLGEGGQNSFATNIQGFNVKDIIGGGGLQKGGQLLGGLVKSLGPAGTAVSALGVAVGAVSNYVADLADRFSQLRGDIQKTTGATGDQLNVLAENTSAIINVFQQDQSRVIQAQNVLLKTFGQTAEESFKTLEKGFLGGADARGTFIDDLNEYSVQIKDAGGDAEDLVNILIRSNQAGIFNDKGIDAVKEFGLRIREQTKPVRDALEDAFGKEFSDRVLQGVSQGSLSTIDALELVATQMDETQIPAEKLQTVMADVFSAAGEDAGMDFIKSLKDIKSGMQGVIDTSNPLVQAQKRQLKLQKELASAQQDLAQQSLGLRTGFRNFATSLQITFTKAFTSFSKGVSALKKDILELSIAEREAVTQSRLFDEISEQITSQINSQVQEVGELTRVINDDNTSQKERLKLVKELTRKYPDLLDDLITEEGRLTDLTKARKRLNDSIIQTAVARAKEARLNETLTKTFDAIIDRTLAQEALNRTEKKINEEITELIETGNKSTVRLIESLDDQASRERETLNKTGEALNEIRSELNILTDDNVVKVLSEELEQAVEKLQSIDLARTLGDDGFLQQVNDLAERQLRSVESKIDRETDVVVKDLLIQQKATIDSIIERLQEAENLSFEELQSIFNELQNTGVSVGSENGDRVPPRPSFSLPSLTGQLREARNRSNENTLERELEEVNISADKVIAGFEKVQKDIEANKSRITIEQYEKVQLELTELFQLSENERQKKLQEIQSKFLKKAQGEAIRSFKEEQAAKLEQFRQSLITQDLTDKEISEEIRLRKLADQKALLAELQRQREKQIEEQKLLQSLIDDGGELSREDEARLEASKAFIEDKKVELELTTDILNTERQINNELRDRKNNLSALKTEETLLKIKEEIAEQEKKISKEGINAESKSFDKLKKLQNRLFDAEENTVELQYKERIEKLQDKLKIDNISEQEELELETLLQQKGNELLKIGINRKNTMAAITDRANQVLADGNKRLMNDLRDTLTMVSDQILDSLQTNLQRTEEMVGKQQDLVERQRERARLGLENTLAFEQQQLAKREAEALRSQRRIEKIEKAKALYASYNANLNRPGADPVKALSRTIRDFAVLQAIANTFQSGGYTGDGRPDEVGGIVHKGEFVIDAPTTKKLGLKNANMNDFKAHLNNDLFPFSKPRTIFEQNFMEIQRKDFEREMQKQATDKFKSFESYLARIEQHQKELKEHEFSKEHKTVDVKKVVDGTLEFVEQVITKNNKRNYIHRIKKDRF